MSCDLPALAISSCYLAELRDLFQQQRLYKWKSIPKFETIFLIPLPKCFLVKCLAPMNLHQIELFSVLLGNTQSSIIEMTKST